MPTRRQLADAIRVLSMDAVQKANSGHPGMPMGMADIAEVLWNDFLKHNPSKPNWYNRDRFILSNGHGAMLQYSLLHLAGYDVSIDDIQNFRQLHSKTPGHPEYQDTPGVETTTGPLGQGIANAVGMALAEKHLAAQFNRPGFAIVDHYTYTFLGDGCLMEGVSHEACSLAGTLGLGKLVAFWDDNEISIDGRVNGWFTDDTPKRFESYGWHVVADIDGHNADEIKVAILAAQQETERPTLICCRTQIGFGAPNAAGTHHCHGSPLGEDEIAATREALNWQYAPFEIPADIYAAWDKKEKGASFQESHKKMFLAYEAEHPELAKEFIRRMHGQLPENWHEKSSAFIDGLIDGDNKAIATRKSSQLCIEALGPLLPEFLGGSADLTGSNLTAWSRSEMISNEYPEGNYIHYGVREFGMSAIMNGMALHGGIIPYGGTFLVFSDYARNAIRLSALMKQRVIYVFTHDSIGLGEDGPTHQPIEHAAMLRATPNLSVWRPSDTVETAIAWQAAIEREGPTCLLLSRQGVPQHKHSVDAKTLIARGAYIVYDNSGSYPDAIIIATGSELSLALDAAIELAERGDRIRVISMPSMDVFEAQDEQYKQSLLPDDVTTRIAVEAGSPQCWHQYVGLKGKIIGMNTFGVSAPAKDIYQAMGITIENIVNTVQALIGEKTESPIF